MALKIFENKKHVFWQAFFLTLLFFSIGIVFGTYLEQARTDNLNIVFSNSEVYLYDTFALGDLLGDSNSSCAELNEISASFADKIYNEAIVLEDYDESNRLTESATAIHRKYDALRTILWLNMILLKEKCPDVNTVVYFYDYSSEDIEKEVNQVVWERVLGDLKTEKGNKIILIPIAADQGILSLDFLLKKYKIEKIPAVLINEKHIFYEPKTTDEVGVFLNN